MVCPDPIIVHGAGGKAGNITVALDTSTYSSYLGICAGGTRLSLHLKAGFVAGVIIPGQVYLAGGYGGSIEVRWRCQTDTITTTSSSVNTMWNNSYNEEENQDQHIY